jgi:transposase
MRQRCPRCHHRDNPESLLFLRTSAWVNCGACGYVWQRQFLMALILRFITRASTSFTERRFWGERRRIEH